MARKFFREVEIRSALLHLRGIIDENGLTNDIIRGNEAVDKLAASLGKIYGVDFSAKAIENAHPKDSYGEIEWLRWAVDGCSTLLGFENYEEMEEAINIDDGDEPDEFSTDPILNAALRADQEKLEALGAFDRPQVNKNTKLPE